MRRISTVAMLSLTLGFLVSCGGSSASGPVGKWASDPAMVEKMMMDQAKKGGAELPPEAMAMMKDAAKSMKLEVEFMKDGTYAVSMAVPSMPGLGEAATSKSKGTWKLNGDKLELTVTEEDGKKPANAEVLSTKFTGATIEFAIPNGGPTLVLKRA